MTSEQKIFPIELVLDSMKDSGYKDAAHAIAELIDNSIQAGEESSGATKVELICLEETSFRTDRSTSRIEKIGVYDNASGMSPEILVTALAFGSGTRKGAQSGIGKFGMGLPNASISQSNRVDVWTWQAKDEVYHTYLDIKEITNKKYEHVPSPTPAKLPEEWRDVISDDIGDSGTLVVWSDLDRLKWKRHKAFFNNVEFIVGRMYRYFISNGSCSIRMAANNGDGLLFDEYVKSNDPLYLMENTNTPSPYSEEGGFIQFGDEKQVKVNLSGKEHIIRLKFSHASAEFRKNFNKYYSDKKYGNPGDTPFGKHCGKNLGISVVRGGRELELNTSFNIAYAPTERWWGAEISFDSALDSIFGVTNNKQAATAFRQISIEDIVVDEDFTDKVEARKSLQEENDPRLVLVEISEVISSSLSSIRNQLKKQKEGSNKVRNSDSTNKAEQVANKLSRETGEGLSDKKAQSLTEEQKRKELEEDLDNEGVELCDEDKARLIQDALSNDKKFMFSALDIRGADIIFDVTDPAGKLKVSINKSHPIFKSLISPLSENDEQSFDLFKLFFASWALMEDKQQDERYRDWLLEVRKEWGYYAKKMIEEYLSTK